MKRFHSSYPVRHFQRMDGDRELPDALWKVARPPAELYVQGAPEALSLLSCLPARGLAIVGSRECQPRSLREINSALSDLKGFDLIIVSGLARGIDAHAHLRAMEEGFPTIAVLGCGIESSYPEENDELRRRILDSNGLVISEFSPDAAPKPDHFIRRNRLIAGWSSATWVVEAGPRSGAINTASWTKQQDRPCFVTPCYPGDPTLEGNQRLLETRQVIEGLIRPFWSARSLGEVWLELESFFAARQQGSLPFPPRRLKGANGFSEELRDEVQRQTAHAGGAALAELVRWSANRGDHPEILYQELRAAVESGAVVLRGGALVAPSL